MEGIGLLSALMFNLITGRKQYSGYDFVFVFFYFMS